MYNKIVLLTILSIVMVLATPTVLAQYPANAVYFEPESINETVPYAGIMVNTSIGTMSIAMDIYFDPSCANITNVDFTGTPYSQNTGWTHLGDHVRVGAMNSGTAVVNPGTYVVAELTFDCVGGDCVSDIEFAETELTDDNCDKIDDVSWINGTFTCGTPPTPCLGACCNDSECTDPFAENMPCSECIAAGKYWHPNKDAACFNGVEPFDLCLDWCPECCDSADNDTDGDIDYPADGQCSCGLDPSETESLPPIPELPTLALAGIGILGIALLARKRD